ncbi:ABC transporter permease subunit [Actinoplanes bogorensis]|uniref:ABC transporter permease subunit n=1 Tax=Paractinoplanes bogorensis TaxID=1610840 RepID=A0ABS5YKN8_9ACTN|nr:ABC transporter permease subunit [Actinoplanes bogorensis]MBU2663606.1 ABC transporter permease subunit [Actinoplanes bogorensis]
MSTLTSEWTKLRSLRSTTWFLGAAVAGMIGSGLIEAIAASAGEITPAEVDPFGGALAGLSFAEFVVGGFAVLAVTNEYASRTIRGSLTAVPKRWPVLAGKAVAVGGSVFTAALLLIFGSFLISRAVLDSHGMSLPAADGVPRAMAGAAVYLGFLALLGTGFAWLVRSTAGGLAALFGVLYGLPIVSLLLPHGMGAPILRFLPQQAGAALMQVGPSDLLAPWAGAAVLTGYAAVVLGLAAVVLRRRDA